MLIWWEEYKPIGMTPIWTGVAVATTQSPDHYTITTGHHRTYADVKKETFHFVVSNRLIVIRLCKFITFETVSEHKWPTRKKSASGVTKVFAEQRKKGTNDLMGETMAKGTFRSALFCLLSPSTCLLWFKDFSLSLQGCSRSLPPGNQCHT